MPESAPQPELLRSLGQLVRGLSVLFWGLPLALVACVQTAQADYLRVFGVTPPVLTTVLVFYGLMLLGRFHSQERVWIVALDRAKIFAAVNVGLSPFLFWWSKVPSNFYYTIMAQTMAVSGILFLLMLNPLLRRLTAMLPDETLRHETIVFTKMNAALLMLGAALLLVHFVIYHLRWEFAEEKPYASLLDRGGQWVVLFLILLTVAMTMALIWKTKEVIFNSVFGGTQ